MAALRPVLVAIVLLLVLTIAESATKTTASSGKKKKEIDTKKYASICTTDRTTNRYPPLSDKDTRGHSVLKTVIESSGLPSLLLKDSPQHRALCWILYDDGAKLNPSSFAGSKSRFLERFALATLYFNTGGATSWEQNKNWLSSKHECHWHGVTCSRFYLFSYRVTALQLSFNKVTGILPREMGYLTDLRELTLNGNSLQGVIPQMMLAGLGTNLERLNIHMNDLFGNVPAEIGKMTKLKDLVMFGNFFFGTLPKELSKLSNLETLDVFANNLTGTIPSELGNMKKLRELYLNDNDFVGKVPTELCALKLDLLQADCLGSSPEVKCDCCTVCCQGMPNPKCKDMVRGSAKKKNPVAAKR